MTKQPTKEYMKEWRLKNRDKILRQRQRRTVRARTDARDVQGLPRVDTIAGLTLRDFIGRYL